jgi:hypothetical protein
VEEQPPVWFHDVLYPDGRPYREREAEILREETGRGTGRTGNGADGASY